MKSSLWYISLLLGGFLAFLYLASYISLRVETGVEEMQDHPVNPDSLFAQAVARIQQKQLLFIYARYVLREQVQQKISFYEPLIKKYAKRYSLDWRLIAAQILQESQFREKAISHRGARGLMQIMPFTAREVEKELGISRSLSNPQANIIGGIYHLAKQIRYFSTAEAEERIKLALAAYNCGAGHVFDAQEICRYYHWDPNRWPPVSIGLTRLTPDYYSVHLEIWPDGMPRYGYLYDYNQPITYVTKIMYYYDILKQIL